MSVTITPQTPPVGTTVLTADATREAKASVDYQSFLKLLVAQMKNQDPTKPMESTEYVAQLASFSQVEQAIQSNSKLSQILQASSLAQADAVIGRTVTSADGAITGVVSEVRVTSDGITAVLGDGSEVPIGEGVVVK